MFNAKLVMWQCCPRNRTLLSDFKWIVWFAELFFFLIVAKKEDVVCEETDK